MDDRSISGLEARFIAALRFQLGELHSKVSTDFSKESFVEELRRLKSDPVYAKFSFDTAEYVLVRLMGRVSISIGRRLGEIYDKIPRLLASAKFDLPLSEISPRIDGLELDVCLKFALLQDLAIDAIKEIVRHSFPGVEPKKGLGIEIRYNFNPNDSARLRKDDEMAHHLIRDGLFPVYLVFSAISPRQEAIARLTRTGWRFLVGPDAFAFTKRLFGVDLDEILGRAPVKAEIAKKVSETMDSLFQSYAFKAVRSRTSP